MTNQHDSSQIEALKSRIAELEQQLAGFQQRDTEQAKLEDALHTFRSLAETAPDGISVSDLTGTLSYANPAYKLLTGYGDGLLGMSIANLYVEDISEAAQATATTGSWQGQLTIRCKNGQKIPVLLTAFVMTNSSGVPQAFGAIARDIRNELQTIEEREQLQEQVIIAQQAALRELSTPLIPITEGVVVMPLIGSIDSLRAQQVMETLLEGITTHQADFAILDITGVKVVDTQVAAALIRVAQASRMLGATVLLSGIGAEIAQTLVQLGTDLAGIVTRSNLQQSINYALERRRSNISNGGHHWL